MAAEVSLQPFRILGVDAIIVFSDILIVAEAMGLPLDVPDSGPVLSNPVRDSAAVRRLRDFDPARDTRFVGDAIRAICKEVGPDVPVIGFAAAPWTLACYMIEGHTRGDISRAKQMLRSEPATGARTARPHRARDRGISEIADRGGRGGDSALRYLGGRTDSSGYDAFELPATQMVFELLARLRRAENSVRERFGALLESLAKSGADVVSVTGTRIWRRRAALSAASRAARECGP